MARRGGLGKGLGALIPPGGTEGTARARAASTSSRWRRSRRTGSSRGTTSTRRPWALLADSIREVGVLQPVLVRPVGDDELRAHRGGAALARRPPGRAPDHPRAGPRDRRRRRARAGAGREPPPRQPQPARGGRRLPAAHRGLRPHPRRRRGPGRPEPRHGHEHAAADAAPARDPEVAPGGQALDGPRPRPAGHARPLVPGAAGQARRRRGPLGAGGGGARCASTRASATRSERPAAPRPTVPPTGTAAGSARPACSSSRSCSATTSRPGSRSRWAAPRGKVVVEFSTLEDLERIYRLMTDGAGRPAGHRRRADPCARK